MQLNKGNSTSTIYSWYVVGALVITSIIAYLDRLIITFLVDPIKNDLQLTDTQIGLLTGLAFAVFYVLMGIPLGRLIDTRDRPSILSTCMGLWSLMTSACGFATNYTMLFIARIGVGIGEAALNPAAMSLIGDLFPKEKVALPIALFTLGIYIGGGMAVILGGYLIDYFASMEAISLLRMENISGWRLVFIVMGLPGLIVAFILFITVKDPRGRVSTNDNKEQPKEASSIREVWEYLKVNRKLYVLVFSAFITHGFYVYALQAWFPAMLMRSYGLSPSQISVGYSSIYLVCGVLGALFVGPAIKYLQKRGCSDAPVRFPLYCVYLMLLPSIVGPLMPDFVLCLLCFAITIFCFAAIISVSLAALVIITPNDMRGLMTVIFLSLMNIIGGAFGAVFVGILSDHVFGSEYVRYSLTTSAAFLLPLAILLFIKAEPIYLEKINENN